MSSTIRSCAFCGQQNAISQTRQYNSKWSKDTRWSRRQLSYQLCEIYQGELKRLQHKSRLISPGTRLLDKLIAREKLDVLHINLHPDGYSVCLPDRPSTGDRMAYEDDTFLSYIDQSLLPPVLANLLDSTGNTHLYHSGHVAVAINNYTHSPHTSYYAMLQPSSQLVVSDANSISQGWPQEERMQLESSLVMATAEPLCLDPDISVALVDNYYQFKQKLFSSIAKPKVKKFPSKRPSLFDFVEKRERRVSRHPARLKYEVPPLTVPASIDVPKLAKPLARPELPVDNSMRLVQEYIMETALSGSERMTKVSILQTPLDEQYFGVLVTQSSDTRSHCTFRLGSLSNVQLYLNQFREIFTEEGRKAVKITHLVPGKAPIVRHTPGFLQIQQAVQNATSSAPSTPQSGSSQTPMLVQQLSSPSQKSPQTPAGVAQSPGSSQSPLSTSQFAPSPQNVVLQQMQPPVGVSAGVGSQGPSITQVHSVQLNSGQLQAVVQQVKNIQAQGGKPQVILQSQGPQQNIVVQNAVGQVQGIQLHQIQNLPSGKVISHVTPGVAGAGKVATLQPGTTLASQMALQLSQPINSQTKTVEVQNVSGQTGSKQVQIVQAMSSGTTNGSNQPMISQALNKALVAQTAPNAGVHTTQSIAEQIAAQISARKGKSQQTVVLQNVGGQAAANPQQIQNIVQQITQQIAAQQKSNHNASLAAMRAIAPNVTVSSASASGGATAGHNAPPVVQTVLQMQNVAAQLGAKPQQTMVLQQAQMATATGAHMQSNLGGQRVQICTPNVTPVLSQQPQPIAAKPQIVLQHAGVQIQGSLAPAQASGQLVQDNRTAMQILTAAVGTAHQATSIQLAAIQRHLQSQREKRN